ncbi:glycosyltransferase family 2 protein [Mucilaginibacter sp.]
MQIIIPMTGEGSRFKAAGYDRLKPMIYVHGKTILEHVVSMFPGDHSFIFVCREDHVEQYDLNNFIPSFCPNATIVSIQPHKLGPVYAALQAKDAVKDDEPIILSYCDYFMAWDFNDFISEVNKYNEDGNVICYSGFHPHLLPAKNLYAGCQVDGEKRLLEIKEKFSFEEDKSKGFHSVGAYYFKSGSLMKHYFEKTVERNVALNGEYYASLVYNLLLEDKLNVGVYDMVPTFCQWGTPEDLEEYLYWADIFLKNHYA